MISFLLLALGYLLGSLNFSLIISRILKLPNPLSQGSGNPGASNMVRMAGKKIGALVFIGDALKGVAAVLLSLFLTHSDLISAWVALAAVIGHCYPVYHRFKGGKGVATAMACLMMLHFLTGLIVLALWLLIFALFRWVSVASIASISAAPLVFLIGDSPSTALPLIIIACLIVIRHQDNIRRLYAGTEPRSRKKKI